MIQKEELRLVTILFADLSGFTALSSRLDPEDVQEVANTCFELLNKLIIKQGGLIHKYEGDLVIALFGLPVNHEDDPERAIKASLEMMAIMPEINDKLSLKLKKKTDLGLHIGINSGIVFVGEIGSSEKKEFTVMGDAVNLASRLKDVAKRGEIIVSETIFRASRYLFEYEVLAPVSLKGIERPVKIFRPFKIKKKPDPKRGIQGLYAPMIGREKEFALLKQKAYELQSGRGGVVFIIGEAGLGKSRLYEELKKHLAPFPTSLLEGRCSLYDENYPYSPFIQILKGIFSITDEDPQNLIQEKILDKTRELYLDGYQEVASSLCQLFSVDLIDELAERVRHLDPQALKLQIFLSIKKLLLSLAEKQPLILVFEDYHWIDSASLEILEFLIQKEDFPFLLLCLTRPEKEKESWKIKERIKNRLGANFSEIFLMPLDDKTSTRLVYHLLNIPAIPEEFKDKILEKAEGNPFYLEEIFRTLIDSGILLFSAGVWRLASDVSRIEIPDTVQSVIISRLDYLEPELKQILQLASVMGRSFYPRVIQNVSEFNELLLTLYLATLEEFEFIKESKKEPEVEYSFRHPLLQEVTYKNILRKTRKRLHNRVAESVEELFAKRIEDYSDFLSYQYYLGENWEKALEYSIKSAAKAKHLNLNQQAIELFDRAIKCAEETGKKEKLINCLKEKSEMLNLIGQSELALEEINRGSAIAREIENRKLEADCLFQLSNIYGSMSKYDDMLNSAQKSLLLYQAIKDRRGEARCLTNIGYVYNILGNYPGALEYYNKSLKIQEEIGDEAGQSENLNNIGSVYRILGDVAKALGYYQKSLILQKKADNRYQQAVTYNNISTAYAAQGDYSMALEYLTKSLKIRQEIGHRVGEAESLNNIGYVHIILNDYERALESYLRSLHIREEIGDQYGQGYSLSNLGGVYCVLGDYSKALKYFTRSLTIRKRIGHRIGQGESLNNIGFVHNVFGDYQNALTAYNESLEIFKEINYLPGQAYSLNNIGKVFLEQGRYDEAEIYFTKAAQIAKQIGVKEITRRIYLALGLLELEKNSIEKAKSYAETAMKLAEELKSKPGKAEVILLQARIESITEKENEAENKFNEAIKIFEEIKQPFDLAKACYYYGQKLKSRNEAEKADIYLKKAKQIFEKCNARIWVKRCDELIEKG